jgi:di/tricarboxylate transporter
MTFEIGLTLAIIGMAIALFASEKLRVDLIALIVLLTVAFTGLVTPKDVFAGFSNSAVVTVWAVYIVSGGLFATGVADAMGRAILKLAGTSETRLIMVIMITCGVMSAFMNNVGATAMLMPALIGVSRQTKVPVSKLLIPLAFSSLLGGNMTLIGTPANILGANVLLDRGMPTFGFFDFAPMGLIVFGTGLVYMAVIGRHFLPVREAAEDPRAMSKQLRKYLTELRVSPDSPLIGKTLRELDLGQTLDLVVVEVIRAGQKKSGVELDIPFEAQDLLIIEGEADTLLKLQSEYGLVIATETGIDLSEEEAKHSVIVEAVVTPNARIADRTITQIGFRNTYGFNVLAVWRRGRIITRRLRRLRLQFGDALLLHGPRERLGSLAQSDDFLLMEPQNVFPSRKKLAPLAIAIMVLVVGAVVFADIAISTAMVAGAVLMILTRCLTMEEAYDNIDWKTVFLVAGMLPLGTAMATTGTARYLADLLLGALGPLGPMAVLTGVYLLTALVTQPMSNAAAVVLMVPIAIDTALSLGVNVQPFVLATVIGASTSFLTPVGHKANILVFGPGGYRFFDYTRVGAPLNLAIMIVLLATLPLVWPLN